MSTLTTNIREKLLQDSHKNKLELLVQLKQVRRDF